MNWMSWNNLRDSVEKLLFCTAIYYLFFFFLLLNYFHMLLRGKSFLSLTSSIDPGSGGSCRKAIVLCIKAPGALGTLIHLPCRWRSQSVSRSGMSDLCDYMDYSPASSSVYGILQARILEWVAIPFSRGSSQPRDQTWVSCIGRQILYHLSHQGRPSCMWIRAYSDIQCSSLTFFFCHSFSDKRERNYKSISLGRW